jgi:creatinine amidohydrolase
VSDARSILLAEMTWPEVDEAAKAGRPAVLALGSTEQHGPHMALSTDCVLPVAIAQQAAERYPLVIAPPIHYGAKSRALSGGGEGFPGTISLQAQTLIATVRDVVEGLARSGFDKICMQAFHAENAALAWAGADLAVAHHPSLRVLLLEHALPALDDADMAAIFGDSFGGWELEHAAHAETSLMLAVRPDLVRADRMVDDAAERRPSWDVVPPPPEFVPASGVLWKASKSNAEAGRMLLGRAADRLIDALTTEFGAPRPRV